MLGEEPLTASSEPMARPSEPPRSQRNGSVSAPPPEPPTSERSQGASAQAAPATTQSPQPDGVGHASERSERRTSERAERGTHPAAQLGDALAAAQESELLGTAATPAVEHPLDTAKTELEVSRTASSSTAEPTPLPPNAAEKQPPQGAELRLTSVETQQNEMPMHLHGRARGQPATFLVDCGAQGNFVSAAYAQLLELPLDSTPGSKIILADGSKRPCQQVVDQLRISLGAAADTYTFSGRIYVTNLPGNYDFILGMPWLARHNPLLNGARHKRSPSALLAGASYCNHRACRPRRRRDRRTASTASQR